MAFDSFPGAARRLATAAFAALVPLAGVAATGLTTLPATEQDGPVTVYYPTAAAARPVGIGPFTLTVAQGAAPASGNGRLIVISHGSGGSPWVYADLARTLVEAGFVVALPEHRDDNYRHDGNPGPESWKRRPAEVSRAIDAIGRDARFAPLVVLDRVGVYGMSAGGHTALTLAGGRWSEAGFARHCEAHLAEDFNACVGLFTGLTGGVLDGLKLRLARAVIRGRFGDDTPQAYTDPRVAAVVAGVPYAADFDMTSFAAPRVPLGLVTAAQDRWLTPRFHSDRVLEACTPCERVAELPDAGHGALLSPLPPGLTGLVGELLNDPPGFDRGVLPAVDQRITAFFARHLAPVDPR